MPIKTSRYVYTHRGLYIMSVGLSVYKYIGKYMHTFGSRSRIESLLPEVWAPHIRPARPLQ